MSLHEATVSDGVRVVVDDSTCIVIEQDRITGTGKVATERYTVTNVARLVEALQAAVTFVRRYERGLK